MRSNLARTHSNPVSQCFIYLRRSLVFPLSYVFLHAFRNYSVCYFEYNWISEQMMDSVLKLTCVPTYALVCLNICNLPYPSE